jgi:protein FAM50
MKEISTSSLHRGIFDKLKNASIYSTATKIFPHDRWEPYDPTKTYEKYSIKDKNKKAP